MKKNIIIGILSFTSCIFFLAAYVQKAQNEKLEIRLREAEKMAMENQILAEELKLVAIQARETAAEQAKHAEMAAKRAMEAAQNTQ